MNLGAAADKVQKQGGFDTTTSQVSRSTILDWISTAVGEAIARSKWRKATITIGTTSVGVKDYLIPTNVVDLRSVNVGSGRYGYASIEDLQDITAGLARVRYPYRGAFAQTFEADADPVLRLWPTPTAGGDAITGVAALSIDPLTTEGAELPLPSDLQERIAVDGGISIGLARVEERQDEAAYYSGRYEEGVAMLTRRTNTRIGSGPLQVRIARP